MRNIFNLIEKMESVSIEFNREDLSSYLIVFIVVCIMITLALLFSKVSSVLFSRYLRRKTKRLKLDETRFRFFTNSITALALAICIFFAIYTVPSLRTLSISLFAGISVITLIVGFAAQEAMSNLVNGIFIALFRPIRIDDEIHILDGDIWGYVEDITLRHTTIRSYKSTRIVIPNSKIGSAVIENFDLVDPTVVRYVEVPVSYSCDVEQAMELLQKIVAEHPDYYDNRTMDQIEAGEPAVTVRVTDFGPLAATLRAYVRAKDNNKGFPMETDLRKEVMIRFRRAGIEIPTTAYVGE